MRNSSTSASKVHIVAVHNRSSDTELHIAELILQKYTNYTVHKAVAVHNSSSDTEVHIAKLLLQKYTNYT